MHAPEIKLVYRPRRRVLPSDLGGKDKPAWHAKPGSMSQALSVAQSDREQAAVALAGDLLRETREELGRADSKASTVLGSVVIVLGLFVAAALAGSWSPTGLGTLAAIAWWAGTTFAAAGVVLLAACIYPNVSNQLTKQVLGYFGHINLYATRDELAAALVEHGERPLDRLTDQLFVLSRVVRRKYRCMRWGMWTLGTASLLMSLALLVSHLRWVN